MSVLAAVGLRFARSIGAAKTVPSISSWAIRSCSSFSLSPVPRQLTHLPLQLQAGKAHFFADTQLPIQPLRLPELPVLPVQLPESRLPVELPDIQPCPLECANRSPLARVPKPANKGARPRCVVMKKLRKRARTGR
eukprot:gb/GFBE01000141.1/.p1 GENE.gb/GFBE01000141.1/~~gb/GFBE01000141.1/.p1  ORF type:complete len:136 (+),score=17.12 gb/GFBE01000141.1/:1-408(+)